MQNITKIETTRLIKNTKAQHRTMTAYISQDDKSTRVCVVHNKAECRIVDRT